MSDTGNQTLLLCNDFNDCDLEKKNTNISAERDNADAVATDYQDIAKYDIIQVAGDDKYGRKVIVFSASKLPKSDEINHNRLLQYMRHMLDMYVENDYIIVYFHYGLTSENRPSFKWLKTVYSELERKYKKNLKNLYIVHPTYLIKIVFKFFLPLISMKFGRKIEYCNFVHELEKDVALDQVAIPSEVKETIIKAMSIYERVCRYDRELVKKHKPRMLGFQSHVDVPATTQFGVNLEFIKAHHGGEVIAPVIRESIDYIRQHGMEIEGLFRRSPNAVLLKQMQEKCNQGNAVKLGDNADDIHIAASLLKSYLRQLPQPLLTSQLYDDFILVHSLDGEAQIKELTNLVSRLPADNYSVLSCVISFLTEVAAKSDMNRMTPQNLGVVFGPSLLWASEVQMSFASIAGINKCIELLIRHYSKIFVK